MLGSGAWLYVCGVLGGEFYRIHGGGPGGQIRWLTPKTQNLGSVVQGQKVYFRFPFVNPGPTDLVIAQVVPSCDCIQAYLAEDEYAPGESGVLRGTLDTNSRWGPLHKELVVKLRGREEAQSLGLDLDIRPTFALDPAQVQVPVSGAKVEVHLASAPPLSGRPEVKSPVLWIRTISATAGTDGKYLVLLDVRPVPGCTNSVVEIDWSGCSRNLPVFVEPSR